MYLPQPTAKQNQRDLNILIITYPLVESFSATIFFDVVWHVAPNSFSKFVYAFFGEDVCSSNEVSWLDDRDLKSYVIMTTALNNCHSSDIKIRHNQHHVLNSRASETVSRDHIWGREM